LAFGKLPRTTPDYIDQVARQRSELRRWGARINTFLDAHCPEYTPVVARGIVGVHDPIILAGIYLDRLVDIQRQLLSTPSASSRQP
jgi:hypothetical protein